MAKALLLAWATPSSEESSAEFNTWYDEVHIPEVKATIPSITTVNRYLLTAVDPSAPVGPVRYLAVYEMDDADVASAAAALGGALGSGKLTMSAAMDVTGTPPATEWYQHV
jgi:hypothetical protein